MSAKILSKTPDEVKVMASENFDDFLNQFNNWLSKQDKPKSAAPADNGGNPPAPVIEAATSQGPPPEKAQEKMSNSEVDAELKKIIDDPLLAEACEGLGFENIPNGFTKKRQLYEKYLELKR